MAAGKDYRQELTAKIIEQLEAGTAPWQKPWEARSRLPYNATTEKPYRGVNSIYLSMVAANRGYEDPRWATYNQGQERGWQVRRGEKGVQIEYWKRTYEVPARDSNGDPLRGDDGKALTREVPLAHPRVFRATVFNSSQFDGIPALEKTQRSYQWDPLERAERIVQSSGARVIYDQGDRAFYTPGFDEIHMPARDQFKDAASAYSVLLHELGHWTGHPSRLNRDLSGAFGSSSYGREELVAELASYFMGDQLGIPHDPTRHASYVQSWIKALSDDKNEIFRAARNAEQVTEYVIGLDRAREVAPSPTLSTIHRRAFDNPERAEVQEAVARAVETDPEKYLSRFTDLPQSLRGRYVSADLMKETFEQYAESKEARAWLNTPVHNSAAVLAAEQMRRVLKEPREPDRDKVLLVTGVPGAGKTSMVLDSGFLPSAAHAVYEGQLAEPKVALEKVRQVLDAGLQPEIMVVMTRPEQALDNTLSRFEEVGRGAGIALMARIQSGLPEGLRAVREEFGEQVGFQVVDRRDFRNPVVLRGWNNLPVVESEGNYEQIKNRLSTHLEQRRSEISDDAYRQAAGLEPQRTERQAGGSGPEERPPISERSETSRGNQEALVLTPQHARARAFAELPEDQAVARHPELKSQFEIWRSVERDLATRFPEDKFSRETYTAAARNFFVERLSAGKLVVEDIARGESSLDRPTTTHQPTTTRANSAESER